MPENVPPSALRRARPEDMSEIHDLFVGTIQQTCRDDYTPPQISAWVASVENTHRWQTALARQYFLVAEIEKEIVGFGSLKDRNYVDFMFVHQYYQRQGIAEQLYQALEHEARRGESRYLLSDVSKTARPFFEKQGFRIERENQHLIREVEITNYRMKKELLR